MTRGPVAKGKRRHMLTLTDDYVNRFLYYRDKYGMPRNQMSLICDEAIREMVILFSKADEKGDFTLKDLFKMMGEQVELLISDEKGGLRNDEVLHEKRHSHSDK